MIRALLVVSALSLGFLMKPEKLKIENDSTKEQLVLQGTMAFLDQVHFSPKEFNDDFSAIVFDNYMKSLDYGKRFLTQEDMSILTPYRTLLDDEIKASSLYFFDQSVGVWEEAYQRARHYYEEILDGEINVADDESLELDVEKADFAKDQSELKDLWRKRIEFEIVSRMERDIKANKKAEEEDKKTIPEIKEKAIKDTREMYDRYFENMDERRRSDYFGDYINSITSTVDPHSNYFSPKKKSDFDMGMSGKLEGIGATLTKDGDYTKVNSLVIGGPAWRGKELEAKDLIMKVAQADEEWVDVVGWRVDDVVLLIRGKAGTTVRLTVKREDGSVHEIAIVRDEVEIGEQFAKSYLLEHPEIDNKIGYVDLPKFYSGFKKDTRNSDRDVQIEVEELMKDSIDGLIIDLRGNPGGSLRDVVNMSGLFIEKGPIVQAVSKGNRQKTVLEDKNGKVTYDGPLLILVDYFSASASEIMAAALQDYDRAVIVGVGGSTYGKGTVQRFFDLNRAFSGQSKEDLGDVKMTIQKYYRVNGSSVQKKGVTPDIVLPSKYQYVDVGEKEYETAMEWTEIEGTKFGQDVFHFDLNDLQSKSRNRVENNESFNLIVDQAKEFKENKESTLVSLNLDEFIAKSDARAEESKRFNNIFGTDSTLLVLSNSTDHMEVAQDSVLIGKMEADVRDLRRDIYLNESLLIMDDLIRQANDHSAITSSLKRGMEIVAPKEENH